MRYNFHALMLATRLGVVFVALAAVFFFGAGQARAVPVNCISCGSVSVSGPGLDGTISYAVISGADFLSEVGYHHIVFSGAVPGGTLDAVPNLVAPTDYVYLYQTVNDGNYADLIHSYEVSLGAALAANITGGGRLESTIFRDPATGIVSLGPWGHTNGLSGGPIVDFLNGFNDPVGPRFGPCSGSALEVACSDATSNLLAGSVQAVNFGETPSRPLLDPQWTSSILWYSTPIAPGFGTATLVDVAGTTASGLVATPIPEPTAPLLFGAGLLVVGRALRRRAA